MRCEIFWNALSLEEWEQRFSRIPRSTLLQSYHYARAVCPLYRQEARWGLITIDEEEAGLVQILEAGFAKNFFHAVVLDRGPLWFAGFGAPDHVQVFFNEFARKFPRRFGRRRRIIPEISDRPEMRDIMTHCGYRRLSRPGYQTAWIDLRQDAETLKSDLRKNWRNTLSKAQRSGLSIDWTSDPNIFSELLTNYQSDQRKKGYDGPSIRLLQSLAACFENDIVIGRAHHKGQLVANILMICHGRSATYQLGWSSDDGRKAGAHNLLLWHSIDYLKTRQIDFLDLGGMNDETAKNVKTFKEGMGGNIVTLAGHYT